MVPVGVQPRVMFLLIFALLLPLSVSHNIPRHDIYSQISKPEVSGIKVSEPEVEEWMNTYSEKQDLTADDHEVFVTSEELESEIIRDEVELAAHDRNLQQEVDVTTPTSIDEASRVMRRSAGSNLGGIPWFDACGEAMPITPRVLSVGRTLHHAAAYNNISNEYLVVFDFDRNYDNLPDRLYATRRNVLCHNTRAATIGKIISISINARWQGWPSIAYNPHKNEYLVAFQARVSSTWVIIGQRISADSNETKRAGNPFIVSLGKDNNDKRFNTINPMAIYLSNSLLYMVAAQIQLPSRNYQVHAVCIDTALQPSGSTVFPFNGSIRNPYLVHNPVNKRVYMIARNLVSNRVEFRYVLLTEDCILVTSNSSDVNSMGVVIGSTSFLKSRFEATFSHDTNSVVCVWTDVDAQGQHVLTSMILDGYNVKKGSGKFNSLDKNPIRRADIVYYPPIETPVVVWEEHIGRRSFLGGSMLLTGSVAQYNVAQYQSHPIVIYVSENGNNKLIVVWRHQVRYDVRVFAQCLCESPRGLPATAQNLIVGRPGLFYWMPAEDRARLSALFTNEIPDVDKSDYDTTHNKMAWYNGTDRTVRVSDLDGQNPNIAASGVNEPGTITGNFENDAVYYTDPVKNSVVRVQTNGNNIQKTVAVGVGDPSVLAVNRDKIIFKDDSGSLTKVITGEDNDDGDDILFDPSLQNNQGGSDSSPDNDTLISDKNNNSVITSAAFVSGNDNELVFGVNDTTIRNIDTDTDTGFAKTIATDVESADSIAATDKKVCWNNRKSMTIACTKNDSKTHEDIRKNVFGPNKPHFQQNGSSNSNKTNPCKNPPNGGCEHICTPIDNVPQCGCKDGFISKGTECDPPEPCPKCSKTNIRDICWAKKSEDTFVFSGEAGGNIEKKDRARYTVKKVKLWYNQSILKQKKLYVKNKSLRVWIKIPICCPTIKQRQTYLFVGKMNTKKQLVVTARGQVMKWDKKQQLNMKKVCQ